jgi:Family of unknown function (DUF6159)
VSSWTDSGVVTRKAWSVIRENYYLLLFPLIGFVFSLVPMALFWAPAVWFLADDKNVVGWVLIVIGVFGTTSVVTFTTGALVAAADEELAGRDSSVGHGFARAFARTGPLLVWSVIQTVVTLLISLVRGNGENGVVGSLLRGILAATLDIAWSLITFFVLPILVLEGASPMEAIKQSAALLRQKWGTQLLGGVRIGGLIFLVAVLPALVATIGGAVLVMTGGIALGVPLIVIGVLVWAAAALVASAMRGIFSVALYRFARDGAVEGPFTAAELQDSVRTR